MATQQECEKQWRGYYNDGWICTDPGFLEDACQGTIFFFHLKIQIWFFAEILDLEWPWLSLKLIEIEVWHLLTFSPGLLTSKPSSLEIWFQGLQFLWRFDAISLRSSFLGDRKSSARIRMALKRHTAVYRLTFLTFFRDSWPLEYIFIETYSKFILGDSGGPAVYYDKHKRAFDIVGVTIAGSETCSTSRATVKAGVYSNVLYYKDFINQATNNGCR